MNLIRLFVHIAACLSLTGCMVFYRTLDTATNDRAGVVTQSDNCQISYLIKPVWLSLSPRTRNGLSDFSRPPYLSDYRQWTESTISELGCKPVEVQSDAKPDLVLVITDVPEPSQYAQASRWISTLTLFIVPIPMEKTDFRRYKFSYENGATRTVHVALTGWLGWIFIPAFPFSEWNYPEKRIFTSQLREYLSEK